jgi:hypothetical protein
MKTMDVVVGTGIILILSAIFYLRVEDVFNQSQVIIENQKVILEVANQTTLSLKLQEQILTEHQYLIRQIENTNEMIKNLTLSIQNNTN